MSYVHIKSLNLKRIVAPQEARLVELLKRDGHVTRLTAMHAGISNVTARVADLRIRARVAVKAEMRKDLMGRRYARWTLENPADVELRGL